MTGVEAAVGLAVVGAVAGAATTVGLEALTESEGEGNNPLLHFKIKGDDNCCLNCCSNSNNTTINRQITVHTQVTVNAKGELVPKKSTSCMTSVLNKIGELFCCCFMTKNSEKHTDQIYERVLHKLREHYSPETAQFFPEIAGELWQQKRIEGSPLNVGDVHEINQTAMLLHRELIALKEEMKRLKFYHGCQNYAESAEVDFALDEGQELKVLKRGIQEVPFDIEMIKGGIKQALTNQVLYAPLGIEEQDIDQIALAVKKRVAQKSQQQKRVISTDEIREMVIQEMKKYQLEVNKPKLVETLEKEGQYELVKSIAQKRHLRELTPEELEQMILHRDTDQDSSRENRLRSTV